MNLRPIKTDKDLDWALKEIDALMDQKLNKVESARFDILVDLVEHYETKHYPVPDADPIDVIHFIMDAQGLRQKDLITAFGSRPRASEVLNRKRPLTLDMARKLSKMLHAPIASLVQEYELAA